MRWRDGIRAVIFDLDSTLVESRIDFGRMKRATLDVLVRNGVDRSVLSEGMTITHNLLEGRRYLRERCPTLDILELDRRINSELTATEMESIGSARALHGAAETLRELRASCVPMAILTRGSREYTLKVLQATGLDGQIEACVCRDDFPLDEAKPNPLSLMRAAALLGAASKDCLYIGDHPMDLDCARAAGATFIGVLTGSTGRGEWRRRGCDNVLDSVAALPLAIRIAEARTGDS